MCSNHRLRQSASRKGKGSISSIGEGARYLDLLSGFGVFAIGRNHPALPSPEERPLMPICSNLVQSDCSTLAGAGRASARTCAIPDKVFFANSGAETVEAAIKFARGATGRSGYRLLFPLVSRTVLRRAVAGMDDRNLRSGFEPLLPGCTQIPLNDLTALEQALSSRQVAAFIVEPHPGQRQPTCCPMNSCRALLRWRRKYGTLFIADEIQTGIGCTGKFSRSSALKSSSPTWKLLAKALSGGHVPRARC